MNDERFVAHVNDTADTVARMKGRACARIIFDRAMIIAVLYVLLHLPNGWNYPKRAASTPFVDGLAECSSGA